MMSGGTYVPVPVQYWRSQYETPTQRMRIVNKTQRVKLIIPTLDEVDFCSLLVREYQSFLQMHFFALLQKYG